MDGRRRCDRRADCQDGSDEMGRIEYLYFDDGEQDPDNDQADEQMGEDTVLEEDVLFENYCELDHGGEYYFANCDNSCYTSIW